MRYPKVRIYSPNKILVNWLEMILRVSQHLKYGDIYVLLDYFVEGYIQPKFD